MVLINVIYFKGKYKERFEQKITDLDTLYDSISKISEIIFMHVTNKYDYFENKDMQTITLNYKKDNLPALIISPKKEKDMNDYIEYLTLDKYNNIIRGLTNQEVQLNLPKFEFDFSNELAQNFKILGMHAALNTSAAEKKKKIFIFRILFKKIILKLMRKEQKLLLLLMLKTVLVHILMLFML